MPSEEKLFLLWLDLETTGLDTQKDAILEISGIVSDWNFKPIISATAQVRKPADILWSDMPEYVLEMHTKSGLKAAVDGCSTNAWAAEQKIQAMLNTVSTGNDFMLAGSGVSRFDIRFLEREMPGLVARLGTYRHLDIAPIRSLLIGTERTDLLPPEGVKENRVHRSWNDARDHMLEAKHYRALLGL